MFGRQEQLAMLAVNAVTLVFCPLLMSLASSHAGEAKT
jgi:hypothetical protein